MKIVEHNNKCLTDDELVIRERERKKKASLYRKQYYEKNKEKIRAKAKQKLEKTQENY
jgi:DNA-binding transcriptional ArsR family regulator